MKQDDPRDPVAELADLVQRLIEVVTELNARLILIEDRDNPYRRASQLLPWRDRR